MIAMIAHSFYALTKVIWNNLLFMSEALAVLNTC